MKLQWAFARYSLLYFVVYLIHFYSVNVEIATAQGRGREGGEEGVRIHWVLMSDNVNIIGDYGHTHLIWLTPVSNYLTCVIHRRSPHSFHIRRLQIFQQMAITQFSNFGKQNSGW